jgi:hypothetical protein
MKTEPADTIILEECYWQTLGIVRSARSFAESNGAGHRPRSLPHKPGRMMTRSPADTESETTRLIYSRVSFT